MKILLEVKNLKKYFPIYSGVFRKRVGWVKAVDGVSYTLKEGEILGVVGESGCGKSTLGKTSVGLLMPTSGEVYYQEVLCNTFNKKEARTFRQAVQVVFQDPYASLNPRKNVAINVGEAAWYHKLVTSRAQRDDYVVDLLETVGLDSSYLNRYPHEFSGGQQQRLCIARALSLKPKVIVCDEAISALDVSIQAQVLNLLFSLKQKKGLSYLFISHDLSVMEHFCDRVLVMKQGKVVEQGGAKEIFDRPLHPYTLKLLSSIPQLPELRQR